MKGYKINNIETLCSFIMAEKPELNKLNELIWHLGIKAIIMNEAEPKKYCSILVDYWQKWKHTKERPIFIWLEPLSC